jgi:hypothetical protein
VPLQSAIAAVIGQPDEFGGTVGQRHKPATWDNPVLLALSQDGTNEGYDRVHNSVVFFVNLILFEVELR